jgi:hypothetical protein
MNSVTFHIAEMAEMERHAGVEFGPFQREWLLYQAPQKVREELELARRYPNHVNAKQGFMTTDTADAPPTSMATIANDTVEHALWNPSVWGLIPAFDMRAGKAYKVSFGGVMGCNTGVTAAWRARCGTNNSQPPTGTDLGVSAANNVGTVLVSQPFYGEFTMVVRQLGMGTGLSQGTVTGNGFATMPVTPSGTVLGCVPFGGLVAAATFAWSSASTTNTLTCQWMLAQSIN